jgi:hypothetical protein
LANSTLAMPDGAGHMLHYQHSAQIADAITALSDR